MSLLSVPLESVRSNKYSKLLEKAFSDEAILFIARVYFGKNATIKIDALWEPSYQESPVMYIIYVIANKLLSVKELETNIRDFKENILQGVTLPPNVLIIPVSFYKEFVNGNSPDEESCIIENT